MRFINFTNLDGNILSINENAIIAILANGTNSVIYLSGGQMFGIRGTRDSNMRLIQNN